MRETYHPHDYLVCPKIIPIISISKVDESQLLLTTRKVIDNITQANSSGKCCWGVCLQQSCVTTWVKGTTERTIDSRTNGAFVILLHQQSTFNQVDLENANSSNLRTCCSRVCTKISLSNVIDHSNGPNHQTIITESRYPLMLSVSFHARRHNIQP